MVLDTRKNTAMWSKFNADLDGSACYLLRVHQALSRQLPTSRSEQSLGESIEEILASDPYRTLTPAGIAPAVRAAGYAKRQGPMTDPTTDCKSRMQSNMRNQPRIVIE